MTSKNIKPKGSSQQTNNLINTILKPSQVTISKPSTAGKQPQSQKQQQAQSDNKPESNAVIQKLVDSLLKPNPSPVSPDSSSSQIVSISKNNFVFHHVVGKGGFGKVWKVDSKKNRQSYAMKEMSKSKIIAKRSVNSVMNERQLLSELKHPFLVNMLHAFQDRENLYLVMDLMTGGDLRYHIGRQRRFTEEQTSKYYYDNNCYKKKEFFVCCILVGLEYLHLNGILHRDIKPENLVLDQRGNVCLCYLVTSWYTGYVRITDLGIARVWRPENSSDTSGTPGYMAPEVMCRQNHGVAVDYFALGVMAYEFMMGRRPYHGRSRREIRDQILAKQVQIKRQDIPPGWSIEAADFINRLSKYREYFVYENKGKGMCDRLYIIKESCPRKFLLNISTNFSKLIQRKPINRLGLNGPMEVKAHPWLRGFPWKKLLSKEFDPPFVPNQDEDNFDQRQQMTEEQTDPDVAKQNALLLRRNSVQSLFSGYFFDGTNTGEREQKL